MADTLGEMILEIDVELNKFRAGLATAKKEAKAFYDDISKTKATLSAPAFDNYTKSQSGTKSSISSYLAKQQEEINKEMSRANAELVKQQSQLQKYNAGIQDFFNKNIDDQNKARIEEQESLQKYTLGIQSQFDKIVQIKEAAAIREQQATQKYTLAIQSQFDNVLNRESDRLQKYSLDIQSQFDKMLGQKSVSDIAQKKVLEEQSKISMYRDMVLSKSGGMSGVQEQAIKDNERFDAQLKGTTKTLATYEQAIARVQRTLMAFGAVVAFRYISQALTFPVEESVRYNAEIEKTRLGIASIVSAQMEMTSASGEQVKGAEKLNKALTMSDDVMKKLKIDNLSTIATFEQLARAYQSALSPGLAAGMNLDQIRQFSVGMVQAAGAMGVNLDMMAEELRSMLRGTITPRNTIIATNLGITNEDIRRYKGDANALFSFIMGKLSEVTKYGPLLQQSFAGVQSNLVDATSMLFGESGNQFFEYLKQEMSDMFNVIVKIDDKTKSMTLNPELLTAMKVFFSIAEAITGVLATVGKALAGLAIGIGGVVNDAAKLVKMTQAYGGQELYATYGEGGSSGRDLAAEYDIAFKYYKQYLDKVNEYSKKIQEIERA